MKKPEAMEIDGRPLTCVVCAAGLFTKRTVTVLTAGVANTGLNKPAEAVTCSGCGFIHHFVLGVVRPVARDS